MLGWQKKASQSKRSGVSNKQSTIPYALELKAPFDAAIGSRIEVEVGGLGPMLIADLNPPPKVSPSEETC